MSRIEGRNPIDCLMLPLVPSAGPPAGPHWPLEGADARIEASPSPAGEDLPPADLLDASWGERPLPVRRRSIRRRMAGWLVLSLGVHLLALAGTASLAPPVPPRAALPDETPRSLGGHDFGEGFGREEGFVYFRVPALHSAAVARPAAAVLDEVRPEPPARRTAAAVQRPAEPATAVRPAPAPQPAAVPPRAAVAMLPGGLLEPAPALPPPARRIRPAEALVDGLAVGPIDTPPAAGGGLEMPRVIHNPRPVYPPEALAARLTGRVVLRVTIGADGTVRDAVLHGTSGVEAMDRAALEVIGQWRFEPRHYGGDVYEMLVPIRFTIEE